MWRITESQNAARTLDVLILLWLIKRKDAMAKVFYAKLSSSSPPIYISFLQKPVLYLTRTKHTVPFCIPSADLCNIYNFIRILNSVHPLGELVGAGYLEKLPRPQQLQTTHCWHLMLLLKRSTRSHPPVLCRYSGDWAPSGGASLISLTLYRGRRKQITVALAAVCTNLPAWNSR